MQQSAEERTMESPHPTPTFVSVAPRFVVPDLERALSFYEQLGFRIDYNGPSIAILVRDGVELHFNHDPHLEPGRHHVCYITVTGSEALYQQYLQSLPAGAVRGPLSVTWYGMREFAVCDPFNTLFLFGEPVPAEDGDAKEQG
jgi:catechol 2,3-dioxygenase-like lactoylglutathione lyase family enzyme